MIRRRVATVTRWFIGGSLAGLLAARVLSDHFERVTLIGGATASRRARRIAEAFPQGRHSHGLLAKVEKFMSDSFRT